MKIKEGFIMRQVAGENVVIPSGDNLDMNMMITLNDSGAFLWNKLQQEITVDELVEAVLAEYKDVDAATAKVAVEGFVAQLKTNDFLC